MIRNQSRDQVYLRLGDQISLIRKIIRIINLSVRGRGRGGDQTKGREHLKGRKGRVGRTCSLSHSSDVLIDARIITGAQSDLSEPGQGSVHIRREQVRGTTSFTFGADKRVTLVHFRRDQTHDTRSLSARPRERHSFTHFRRDQVREFKHIRCGQLATFTHIR